MPALLVSSLDGTVAGFASAILVFFLSLMAMRFMAALGICSSARSQSSWRSLLEIVMLGMGYVIGFFIVVFIVLGFGIFAVGLAIFSVVLMSQDKWISGSMVILLMFAPLWGIFQLFTKTHWNVVEKYLVKAEEWINKYERARPTSPSSYQRELVEYEEQAESESK